MPLQPDAFKFSICTPVTPPRWDDFRTKLTHTHTHTRAQVPLQPDAFEFSIRTPVTPPRWDDFSAELEVSWEAIVQQMSMGKTCSYFPARADLYGFVVSGLFCNCSGMQ